MKKVLKVTLKVFLAIVALIVLLILGLLAYLWARNYIFYPRTIGDVIARYENMSEEKQSNYGYSYYPDKDWISYRKRGGSTYKDSIIIKNRIEVHYKKEMGEDFLNSFAEKYNAEVIKFDFDTVEHTSDNLGIELKKSHSEKELEALAQKIKNEPYVRNAYTNGHPEPAYPKSVF